MLDITTTDGRTNSSCLLGAAQPAGPAARLAPPGRSDTRSLDWELSAALNARLSLADRLFYPTSTIRRYLGCGTHPKAPNWAESSLKRSLPTLPRYCLLRLSRSRDQRAGQLFHSPEAMRRCFGDRNGSHGLNRRDGCEIIDTIFARPCQGAPKNLRWWVRSIDPAPRFTGLG